MSDQDVYDDEMPRADMTHREVESVLTGQVSEDAALARLNTLLTELHQPLVTAPSDEQMVSLAVEAAAIARETRAESPLGAGADEAPRARPLLGALRERMAVVAIAFFVVAGMTGVAVASDSAVPGDPLYGLDRALEVIGIGDGGTPERIAEAQVLANRGQVVEAIDHVAEAIAASGDGEQVEGFSPEAANAAAALRDAAASVESASAAAESDQVRDAVAEMLGQMAEMADNPNFDPAEFGHRIVDMARSIGGPGNGQDIVDQPGGQGGDRVPGDKVGPPADVPGGGPPSDAGRP